MPIEVDVPDFGIVEFPDDASEEDISKALSTKFGSSDISQVKLSPYEQAKSSAVIEPPILAPKEEGPLSKLTLSPLEQAQAGATPEDLARASEGTGISTEFTKSLAEGGKRLLEKTVEPVVELVPKLTKEPLRRFLTMASPTMTAAVMRQRAMAGEPIRDITTPESERFIGTVVGVQQSLADSANFFTSPLGIATLGIGALPKAAQATVSAAFAADMARQLPGIHDELVTELRKPEQERDYEKIANLTTTGITTLGFSALGGLHAAGKGVEMVRPKLAERAAFLGGPAYDLPAAAETAALRGTLPESAQRFAPGGLETAARAGTVVAEPGVPLPEAFQVEEMRRRVEAQSPEGLAEAKRQAEIRAFEARIKGIKPPKPEVPEGPTPEELMSGIFKEAAQPEPPKPAKPLETFDDFVEDLKKKGNPDMSIREVQALYPEMFPGGSNREGARRLTKEAFGERPTEQPVTKEETVALYHGEGGTGGAGFGGAHVSEKHEYAATFGPNQSVVNVPRSVFEKMKAEAVSRGQPNDLILPKEWINKLAPVEKPITPPVFEVEELGAADWLEKQFNDPKVRPSNITSKDAGMRVKNLDDVTKLADMRIRYMEESKKLIEEARNLPTDQKIAALTKSAQVVNRAQLSREAIETATNIGGWEEGGVTKIGDRPLDWKKNPEVAKWLKENAERLDITLPDELSGKKAEAAPQPQTVPSLMEFPPTEIPANEIATRADLMQFRQGALETGETVRDKLTGKWDELKAGLLLLWEPKNPTEYGLKEGQKYIVANGHHRFTFGQQKGVKAHAAQVLREADGFSAQDARRIAAEANIADGKGTVYDQVKFLRNIEGARSPDEQMAARERIGGKGRQAATIAFDASDDVYSSFVNERITPEQAEAIAAAAPKNAAAQAVGLRFAEKVENPDSLSALVRRALAEPAKKGGGEMDLFGFDDSAIKKMEAEEAKAEKIRQDLRERINAIRGAGKRVDIAKSEGVDVKDPAAIEKRINFLKGELERWKSWWLHSDLAAQVRGVTKAEPTTVPAAPPVAAPPSMPQPKPPVEAPTSLPSSVPPQGKAPSPEPTPAPTPGGVPPAPSGAPVTPEGKPIVPTGHFGKPDVDSALDRLRKKREQEKGRLQTAAEEEQLVIRPEAEKMEIQAAAEAETPELFAGEKMEDPLFEQATLRDLTTVGGNFLEKGIIAYPDFYKAMVEAVGPEFKRYFRRAYNQVRDVDSLHDVARFMTSREEVELYNDDGVKVGKGAGRRPGLIVRNEELMPRSEEYVTPNTWIGPDGDSIDWTQARAINLALRARFSGLPAMMVADGPGVGKSGVGAAIAHKLTFQVPEPLHKSMSQKWETAPLGQRADWLFGKREHHADTLSAMAGKKFDTLKPEEKLKVYRNYGFNEQQIREDNVAAGATERKKVLVVGTSKEHITTSFKPDFEKFGIPLDNIEFITYNLLSNPGMEGTAERRKFDAIMDQEWGAVVFDEAHALKNAGSNREHNSRKLKTPFKVFMTATPMDNVPNAVYFFSEITGKTKEQIMDQLGLRRLVKVVNGEDREYVVQKPGISAEDVKAAIIKLREESIGKGLMVRREFPWWGDVIGRDRETSLYVDMDRRWSEATSEQKAEWIFQDLWENADPMERARMMLPSYAEGEMPKTGDLMATSMFREYTPAEIERVKNLEWDKINPATKAKIFDNSIYNMSWANLPEATREAAYKNADYTPKELETGIRVKKGDRGPFWMDSLTDVEAAEQQKIFDSWQAAIDKSRNPMVRRNLAGQMSQELKRWNESIKAKKILPYVLKELEAGRNVVLFGNSVNAHYVKGLGESGVWATVKGMPNPDWPKFPGGLGVIAAELKRLNIPFSQIFGPVKDMKTAGIRDFYANRKRVALVTPQSGGAGLNLDDVIGRYPRTLIVSDINWAGDLFEQLMYRVSRRNTASESKAHIMMIPNSISDSKILRSMNRKLAVLRGIQAGKDTDLMTFLDDLNNPEALRTPETPRPNDEPSYGDFPAMQWKEVRGRTGKLRWSAPWTDEFNKWWLENGEEKNPLGLKKKIISNWGQKWEVWSDAKPDWNKPAGDEFADPEMQESSLGGYKGEPKYSGLPYDALVSNIEAYENLVREGFDITRNQARVDEMKAELDRRKDLDDRVENMLLDDPEYQGLLEKMNENPDHTLTDDWRVQRDQIVSDVTQEAEGTIPEPQAATVGPNGSIPSTVIPKSLVMPKESMLDITRKLRKGIGIPFRYKSWLGGGFFDPMLKYIRIKRVNDYPAMLHEAGHALDNQYEFWKNPTVMQELNVLGDPATPGSRSSWKPGKSVKYKLAEGVAEFIRYWAFDPAKASAMAPNMEKLWNSIVDANEKELGFMREIQGDIQDFRKSDKQAQLRSMIVTGNKSGGKYTLPKLVESVFDDMHFLKLASDDAFQAMKTQLPPSRDAYLLYRLLRGNYGRADAWVRYGTIDAKTGDIKYGKSLSHALEPVKTDLDNFKDWIVAREADNMIRNGVDPGIEPDVIKAVLDRFQGNANFKEAHARIQEWNEALLRYAVDSGYLTELDYKRIKKAHMEYIPMRRFYEVGIGEEAVVGGGGTGRQAAKITKPSALRLRKGSLRPILDPLGSLVENAYFMTFATEKNRALLALADYAGMPDMAKWIGPYPSPKEKVSFPIERIKKQLKDAGVDVKNLDDDLILTFWRESQREVLRDNVIRVRRNGKNEYYQLDPDLYRSVMASDKFTLDGFLKIAAYPSQILRAGVTADPSFALYRNILRDTVSAAIISKYTVLPFESAARGAMVLFGQNLAKRLGFKNQEALFGAIAGQWKAHGGSHSVESAYYDRDVMKEFVKNQVAQNPSYWKRGLYWVTSPLHGLRALTAVGEQSTRIGEYQKVFNSLLKEGWSRKDAHLQAAFESRDLQDFAMGGSSSAIKLAKILTAFFNAGIQGRYRFFRGLVDSRNPDAWKHVLMKGFGYITTAKMLEQYINWDNEDYWAQPRWQRMMAFHIPLGKSEKTGQTNFMLIPVPFEAGLIFATLPGAMMEYVKQRNVDSATAFASHFADQMIDNPVPQWMMTVAELIPDLGYDFFQNKPILNRGMENEPYQFRYTDTTSTLAKKAGAYFDIAPAKIEHAIRRTTGGVGATVVHSGIDKLIELKTGEPGAPLPANPLRTVFTQERGPRSQVVDDFYKKLGILKREYTSRTKHQVTNKEVILEELPYMLEVEKMLAEIRKQYQGSRDLETRYKLSKKMEDLARKWVRNPQGRYKSAEVKAKP